MPPLKSDVWTWDTLIHIAIIIAVAIIARWLLRKGVDWTIHLMVSRSEKREATMPGRTRRILAEATGASIDRQNQRTATVGGLLSNVGVTIIIIVALLSGFSTIGFKITPILTSAGIVGVALAFGAQTLVKDVLAGLFIIFEDQYGVGDVVVHRMSPAAAVADGPVRGAIAPPSVDLFRHRDPLARDVEPFAMRLRREQLLGLDRGVRDHLQQLPVRPHVVLVRRDVEVADQDVAVVAARMQRFAALHLVEELQLVLELRIERGIWNVAAGRHVEIMQHQRLRKLRFFPERYRDVPRVDLVAERPDVGRLERQARDDGDAVIALLPVQRDMLIAEPLEALQRKRIVDAFGLLQAQHIRPRALQEFGDDVDAQAHRIDVPGGDGEPHESCVLARFSVRVGALSTMS